MSPSAIFFPKSASFSQVSFRHLVNFLEQFLSKIDLGYVQLIKVASPDGTIPKKPFNVT